MSNYYNAKRTYGIFNPDSDEVFKLSRTKIDLFLNCPRCFYLDRRMGIGRPPMFPYTLSSAVDILLKKEFDIHRAKGEAHPMMRAYKIEAVPFQHEKMDEWRDALRGGIQYLHKPTNLLIGGGIDDIWINPQKELIIVDYKSTAKNGEINLDAEWQDSYKRQMEIYQWLFRKNDFKVSETGYFVYANGRTDKQAFDGKLEFDVVILSYKGDDSWVEKAIVSAHKCLISNEVPSANKDCDYCAYNSEVGKIGK